MYAIVVYLVREQVFTFTGVSRSVPLLLQSKVQRLSVTPRLQSITRQ